MKVTLPVEILIRILQFAENRCKICKKYTIIPYVLLRKKYYCSTKCFPCMPSNKLESALVYSEQNRINDVIKILKINDDRVTVMIDWIMKRRKKNNERAISKNFKISNIKEFYVDKYVNTV